MLNRDCSRGTSGESTKSPKYLIPTYLISLHCACQKHGSIPPLHPPPNPPWKSSRLPHQNLHRLSQIRRLRLHQIHISTLGRYRQWVQCKIRGETRAEQSRAAGQNEWYHAILCAHGEYGGGRETVQRGVGGVSGGEEGERGTRAGQDVTQREKDMRSGRVECPKLDISMLSILCWDTVDNPCTKFPQIYHITCDQTSNPLLSLPFSVLELP